MSLKTFINYLWAGIQNLFNGIPADVKTAIHIGVVVTENLKNFVDSPAADILTALIPGEIDDVVKTELRAKLPGLLAELKLADDCGTLKDPVLITTCAVRTLQALNGDIKSAFLHNLSILIAQIAADGKLSWDDGATILEWYYQNKFKAA